MSVNVFLAKLSNPASNAVFEKVRDWSLSGLVRNSFWIDIEEPTKVIRVTGEGFDKVDALNWIATDPGVLKFYVVQVLKSEGSAVNQNEVAMALAKVPAFEKHQADLVNLIFPVSETKDATDIHFKNNLNLISLPSDAGTPLSVPLDLTKKSNQYFSNCAKELVTIAGLWPGQSESMLEGVRVNFGFTDNVLLSRSFVRYVDASSFVKSVIDKVIDGDGKSLAVPIDASGRELHVVTGNEAEQAVAMVAEQFKATHDQLLFVEVPNRFGRPPMAGNLFKLLGYYFTWIWNWIIRQPANILQKAIADRKLAIAKSVQDLFGTKSEFMVLVGGVSAHEYPDGIPMAAHSIMETVQSQLNSPVVPAPAAPAALWKEMIEVATSLADGSPLTIPGIEMPALDGIGRRVITDPNLITPNYFEKSFDIPANLNVPYKGHRILSSDPLTARLVQERLDESLRSGTVEATSIAAIGKLQQDLSIWRNSNRSFVWSIGDQLADSIFRGLKTWEDLSARVQDINTDSLIAAEERAQKSLARLFKGVFTIVGVSLVLWGIQAVYVYMSIGQWPGLAPWWVTPATIVGVLILIWNIIGISMMYGAVKELFRLEHELEKANDRVAYAKEARAKIWQQISRLTTYYQQYQAWVVILSSFVHKNSKASGARKTTETISGAQALPQSMTIARLVPDYAGNDQDLAKRVAQQYYTPGWLNNMMTNLLSEKVVSYNNITADSMASKSTPLGLALAWVNSPEVFGAIKASATNSIQQLATSGTAYQSWKVELTNAVGDKAISHGDEFIGQLGKGNDFLPANDLLTAKGSVSNAAQMDKRQSACGFDQRLSLDADLTRRLTLEQNTAESRSLDFLGIRFEVSNLIAPSALKMFGGGDSNGSGNIADTAFPQTPA